MCKSVPHRARFTSSCVSCGVTTKPGSAVWYAKGYGTRCERCGPHPQDAKRVTRRAKKDAEPAPEVKAEPAVPAVPAVKQARSGGGGRRGDCSHGDVDYTRDRAVSARWESVSEATEFALNGRAVNDDNDRFADLRIETARTSGERRYYNRQTPETLAEMIKSPPAHILRSIGLMVERLGDRMAIPARPIRRVARGREFGDELDVDRWLSRDPDAWDRADRIQVPRRVVRVACDLTVNANQSADELLARGAAAVALADYLCKQGASVELVAVVSIRDISPAVTEAVATFCVKKADMPMDLGAAAVCICEVGWFRIVGLNSLTRVVDGKAYGWLGYATPMPASAKLEADFVIGQDVRCEEAAGEWIDAAVSKYQTDWRSM